MPNFYEILGVANDASESEIKKAYRTLSLKFHPDRNMDDAETAKKKFQEINEAYEHLSDQGKRRQYDHELKFGQGGGFPGQGHVPEEFTDINNIFNMIFGQGGGFPGHGFPGHGFPGGFMNMHGMGGGPEIRVFHNGMPAQFHHSFQHQFQQQIRKPDAIVREVELTLEQCYQGCVLPIEIERFVQADNIRRNENEMLYVSVPQGADDGESIIMTDKGHNINNSVYGDVRIVFRICGQCEFTRAGLDIIYKKTVSLKEALCGFSFEMNHLNGKRLCLNNLSAPTVIKPAFRKVVQGMGMIRENSTGNMIIEFDVEFPETLTSEQIAGLKEIL
uniref:J domain-containing protein n=1 Tax=viral metagenome TaxID=1070528 RepID=A0A6C0ASI7_9ZZZZ